MDARVLVVVMLLAAASVADDGDGKVDEDVVEKMVDYLDDNPDPVRDDQEEKNYTGISIRDLPDTFCYYTVCVGRCSDDTLGWVSRKCHLDDECSDMGTPRDCSNETLSNVETAYNLGINIPALTKSIEETLKDIKDIQGST